MATRSAATKGSCSRRMAVPVAAAWRRMRSARRRLPASIARDRTSGRTDNPPATENGVGGHFWRSVSMRRFLILIALFIIPCAVRAQTIPRTADGKPDLSGIWQVMNTAASDIQDHAAQKGVPAGPGVVEGNDIPYKPEALAQKKKNYDQRATLDPDNKCYLPGVPRITYMPYPFQIVQKPNELTILYEYVHTVRYIFANGAPHPKGPIEWWLGDSRGRWEGDTLVVDVVHFNDQTWFDRAGNFHSDALHVVERYTPTDAD